jgi:anti-sigma B factor antagonist
MTGETACGAPHGSIEGEDLFAEPQFHAEVGHSEEGVPILGVAGEVDIHTAGQFKLLLLPLVDDGRQHVVVDAAQVTFMDSTALGVFLSGERRVRPRGGSIVIVCSGSIARLFEITGLDRVFTICGTRAAAVRIAATRRESLPPGAVAAGAPEDARR